MNYWAVMKSQHILFSMPATISSLLTMGSEAASYETGSRNIQSRIQMKYALCHLWFLIQMLILIKSVSRGVACIVSVKSRTNL